MQGASMAVTDWTNLAIAGSAAILGAALILRTLSGPVTTVGHRQRFGEIAVYDAHLSLGLRRFPKPGRVQLAIYVTLRKSPLEPDEGRGGDAHDPDPPIAK
jgi:hypothetical protein